MTTTALKVTAAYRRILDRLSSEPATAMRWSFPFVDRPRIDQLISRGLLAAIEHPTQKDDMGRPAEALAITDAGRKVLYPPLKPRKTIPWRRERKASATAVHMFTDAANERVELLAYDRPEFDGYPRMCGFEIFVRDYRGMFHDQVGAGEAENLEAAKAAALAMIALPRDQWAILPRSWFKVPE